MASIRITSNAAEKAARMESAAAATPAEIITMMAVGGSAVGPASESILKGFTPVRTGRLRDSTTAVVSPRGFYCSIQLSQGAVSDDGVAYGAIVRSGRGPVDPVNKMALASPDWPHPWHHSGPAAPNDYVERATAAMKPMIHTIMRAEGRRAAVRITHHMV